MTGVDTAPTLVALCRARFPEQQWVVADMRELSLGQRYEGVLAWDSFFHLAPDAQRTMFETFSAHAAPSSLLMFNTGPRHGESIGSYRGDPVYHASLDADAYRALLTANNFVVLDHVVEDRDAGGRTVWLAKRV